MDDEIFISISSQLISECLAEEKDREIERLTAESTEWESKCYKYQDIIKEVREIVKLCNTKCSKQVLEILDKDSDTHDEK